MKRRSNLSRVAGFVAASILILGVAFYFLQDRLIFQAVRLDRNHAYTFVDTFEEHFIATPDHQEINVLLFKTPHPSKGLILYFHGNADNLQRWGNYAGDFTKYGYDVLMMDYRGYGKSTGKPNEVNLYRDAGLVFNWAKANLKFNELIIYGRSLGTAVASHLAMTAHPKMLILETPFDELRGAILPILKPLFALLPFNYSFPTIEHLASIHCRTIIFHGTNDMITPISSALKLKPLLQDDDEFVVIEEGTHGNLRKFEQYHIKLSALLQ